jgi:hypothetical protein
MSDIPTDDGPELDPENPREFLATALSPVIDPDQVPSGDSAVDKAGTDRQPDEDTD